MDKKIYMCIDLKSFYASVECADRGLDPFKHNLAVADPSRGGGAICLAVTPAMKSQGVKNRCRVYEIPDKIKYITALPRMKRYMEVSAQIYGIYLRYISAEDIHVYSIDECFIDAAPYMDLYKTTPKQLARKLMTAVFEETRISSAAGIGTNLFLAKIALDITAKHSGDGIGVLDEEIFRRTLWRHRPITDFWNIGAGTAKRLEKYGIYDLQGVTKMDRTALFKEFGVNGQLLLDHAFGIEPCTIAEIHNYEAKSRSISTSQVLFEDYSYENALIILKEMADSLCLELSEKRLAAESVSLTVGYSKDVYPHTGGTRRLLVCTASPQKLSGRLEQLFAETTRKNHPIRTIGISFGGLCDESFGEFDLSMTPEQEEREKNMQNAILEIRRKFGKNAVIKAMSLQEKATGISRNRMVGGHNGG